MYNKNPSNQEKRRDTNPRKKTNQNTPVSYKVSSDRHIREALEIASGEKQAEEAPAAEDKEEQQKKDDKPKKEEKQKKEQKKKEETKKKEEKKPQDKAAKSKDKEQQD